MKISDYSNFAKRFFALECQNKWLYQNLVIQRPSEELTKAINDPRNPFSQGWTPEKSGYSSGAARGTEQKSSSTDPNSPPRSSG